MTHEDDIRALLRTYETSLNSSDAALAASLYAVDGQFMPTTQPTIAGEQMLAGYTQLFRDIRLDVSFDVDEVVVASDDVAYALTRSHGTQTVLATGARSRESNREVFLFTRTDGEWKIHRYLFNKPG